MNLPVIPSAWSRAHLSHVSRVPITNGLGEAAQTYEDGYIRYIRTTDISDLHHLDENKKVGLPPELGRQALVKRGDLLMTAAGSLGTSYLHTADGEACYAGYLVRFRADPTKVLERFIAWWTQSRDHLDQIALGAVRSTIDNFSAGKFRSMSVPIPPLEEQRGIADYLDRETAQIDALIKKQHALIERLQERRSSVLERGLTSDETIPLKRLVQPGRPLTYGILQAGPQVEGGVPYVGPSDISGRTTPLVLHELRTTTQEIAAIYSRSRLQGGDIVVSIGPAYGHVTLISTDLTGANLTQDTVRVAVRLDRVRQDFIMWALRSPAAKQFWDEQIGGATFRRLNLGTLGQTPIPVMSLERQGQVVDHLNITTNRIDSLIAKADRFIELAKERRSALITAAVTGQMNIAEAGAA